MKTTNKRGRKPAAKKESQQDVVVSKPKLNLVDDKHFFDAEVHAGFTTTHYEALVKLHTNGAKDLQSRGINSVFEFGAGLGFFLKGANDIGLKADGVDINKYERDFAISKGVTESQYRLIDGIDINIDRSYNACYCVEVLEHLYDEALDVVVPQIAEKCEWLFMTSTPHTSSNDEAWGHVNIKSKEGWIDFMAKHKYTYVNDWNVVTQWGLVFRKS
jgi:2-polyprenyl-3-methyl-5-hydroxy-6-metoxy-1,4-benzoquinol methylase